MYIVLINERNIHKGCFFSEKSGKNRKKIAIVKLVFHIFFEKVQFMF